MKSTAWPLASTTVSWSVELRFQASKGLVVVEVLFGDVPGQEIGFFVDDLHAIAVVRITDERRGTRTRVLRKSIGTPGARCALALHREVVLPAGMLADSNAMATAAKQTVAGRATSLKAAGRDSRSSVCIYKLCKLAVTET